MSIETRCTQCSTKNDNPSSQSKYGAGNAHGTEVVFCSTCSGSCNLDSCVEGDPCDRCYTETVQNRCGKSVPTAKQ